MPSNTNQIPRNDRRTRFSIFLMALCFLQSSPVLADGDNTIFELGDFAFESGVTLPNARLSYVTYGALR